jgi:hypothetical protein
MVLETIVCHLSFLARIRCITLSRQFSERLRLICPKDPYGRIDEWIKCMEKTFICYRKYIIQNTPFKKELEPDYKFQLEPVWTQGNVKTVCTVIAPSVIVCRRVDLDMIAYSERSFDPDKDLCERGEEIYDASRIQTRIWEISNPLFRMLSIWLHRHEYCEHAFQARAWVETCKESLPEARVRKTTWLGQKRKI